MIFSIYIGSSIYYATSSIGYLGHFDPLVIKHHRGKPLTADDNVIKHVHFTNQYVLYSVSS